MKFPDSLKIGAHEVKVVVTEHWKTREGDLYAEWIPHENTIYIANDVSETMQFSSFIHEIFHVMNATLDHALLDSLAEQISQVLLENGLIDEE